ncbi:glycosyltransferase, partial [Patescibacteria group bacterium]|nr:glycosyltransferase [Patescibacteria group bacterium]
QYRNEYDGVFIHMNQEYVILGGLLWRLLGKKVALWRNHQAGGFWVKLAVLFSHLVFCTSRFAFVARYKKNRIMPVGINTDFFKPNPGTNKISRSTLFFSRISPIKRLDLLVDALNLLKRQNVDFTAKIVGDAPARDAAYLEENKRKVRDLELEDKVEFKKGEPNCQAPAVYQQSEVFINLTNSGSLDKTTMEAMACEQLVLVSNRVFENIFSNEQQKFLMFREGDADDLAKKIKGLFDLEDSFKKNMASQAREIVVSRHSLAILAVKLFEALSK